MENHGFEADAMIFEDPHENCDSLEFFAKKVLSLIEEKEGEDVYPMSGEIKGEVFILNVSKYMNKNGPKVSKRFGSQNDVEKLKNVWTRLGHKVTIHQELTAEGFKRELVSFLTNRNFKGDCCTIFIMTHGQADRDKLDNVLLVMHDNEQVSTDWIFEQMNSKNASHLVEKPKLLFLNACRGDKLDAVRMFDDKMFDIRAETLPTPIVPIYSNILLAFPCSPGCVALRNIIEGSLFVQTFVAVLQQDAGKHDMITMLQKVGRILLKITGTEGHGFQTVCMKTFGFYKKLYLNPPQDFNKK